MIPNGEVQLKVHRSWRPEGTRVVAGNATFGGNALAVVAGPCAVESFDQVMQTALGVQAAGANMLRGGAFKPRTSPYAFRGLLSEGLALLAEARRATQLPVVTEVLDPRHLEQVCAYADMVQIGSRSMQNFPLLEEVGRAGVPVLLKRGMSATVEEFLYAAEYVLSRGNEQVVLCERGIRTFEPATRNTLDLNAVPLLRRESHLPVIVDPSHGSGHAWMVPHLARAAVAVGADGLLIEVHPKPESALSDGAQSLTIPEFEKLMHSLRPIAEAVGRSMRVSEPVSTEVH